MPYAKIDVSFLRDHFVAAPEKDRAAAIALYVQLVLTSAELLLDGYLPAGVLEAGGAQVGISRGRYARREIASAATSLRNIGLLEDATAGGSQLTRWHEHHSSRTEIETARTRAAERKRRSRGQLMLEDEALLSHRDVTAESQRENGVTSRVRGTDTNTDKELTRAVDVQDHDDEPDVGDRTAQDQTLDELTPALREIT